MRIIIVIAVLALSLYQPMALAGEHGGSEHGGAAPAAAAASEHGGASAVSSWTTADKVGLLLEAADALSDSNPDLAGHLEEWADAL